MRAHPRPSVASMIAATFAAIMLAIAPGAVSTAGASFTTHTTAPTQTATTADLANLTGASAEYDETGTATVMWDTPTVRADVAPAYTIARSIDGVASTVAPVLDTSTGATVITDDLTVPATIEGKTVTAISAGYVHSCAIADGAAYCWGNGLNGQLGNGTSDLSSVPVAVSLGGVLAGRTVTAISAGYQHSCAVADGAAYCWGNGASGRLGNGHTSIAAVPVAVSTGGVLAGKIVTAISAGYQHSCAVADGAAYCWGSGASGRLGNDSTVASSVPVAVDTGGVLAGRTVTLIAADGREHSCAVADGAAYCWGANLHGQLGRGGTVASSVPVAVDTGGVLAGRTVSAISVSKAGNSSCAVVDGAAACWGNNLYGQLGNGGVSSSSVPVAVYADGALAGKTVTALSAGSSHVCGIADGAAYCWGEGRNGRIGDGDVTLRRVPAAIESTGALAGKTVTQVAAGDTHSCAVADSVAYCWGNDSGGQLGDDGFAGSSVPVAVDGSDALRRAWICAAEWLPAGAGVCAPGPNVPVSYEIAYRKAGWSPPASTLIPATWEGTP